MTLADRAILLTIGAVTLAVGVGVYRAHVRGDVLREAAYQGAAQAAADWQDSAKALANVERIQRDTVTVRVTRFRTTAAKVDTMFLRDTVPVPVEVVRTVIVQADSAVRACERVIAVCEQRSVALDSVVAAQSRQLKLAPKPPGRLKVWGERLAWMAAVVLVAR